MNLFEFRLRNAPLPAKIMIASLLLSLSLAYVYALGNVFLVVGWTPKDIAIHYYGAEQVVELTTPTEATSQGEEEFSFDDFSEPAPKLGFRPSFKNLVQEGHFHLFGMTSFFFILTTLALFTGMSQTAKIFLVGTPYLAVILDNLSFMATRFLGPHFAYLTAVSGGFLGICFTALCGAIAWETMKKADQ